jgi:hypothetical protein
MERDCYGIYRGKYPSSLVPVILIVHTNYEDGTVFRNVGTQNSGAEKLPKMLKKFVVVFKCVCLVVRI